MKVLISLVRSALLRTLRAAALKLFQPVLRPELKPAYIHSHARHSRRPEIFEGESRRLDEPNRW